MKYLPEFQAHIILPKENNVPELNEIRADIITENLTDRGIPLTRIQVNEKPSNNPNVLNLFIEATDSVPLQKMTALTKVEIKTTEPELKEKFIEQGKLVIFPIYFSFNKHICQTNEENMRNLSNWLKKNKKAKIEIIGYTDNIGTDDYNIKLSKRRAEYVKKQLELLGVDKNRMVVKGMGKQNPVASNDTPEGRQMNRRVEFRLINVKANDIIFKNKIDLASE